MAHRNLRPTAPLTGGLTRFRSIFPGAAYLSFGFGERLYFQKAQTGAVDMVSAIFPGPGTVLTTALSGPPSEMYSDLDMVPIRVTRPNSTASPTTCGTASRNPQRPAHPPRRRQIPRLRLLRRRPPTPASTPATPGPWKASTAPASAPEPPEILFAYQVMETAREIAARRAKS
jgi:hypothetical protein